MGRKSKIKKSTYVLWRGPSMYNGAEIRVVVSNLKTKSANDKIGDMAQIWILPDSNEKLVDIMARGDDVSYCGECPLRWFLAKQRKKAGEQDKGKCYVTWIYAPNNVHRSTHDKPTEWKEGLQAIRDVDKPIRVGAAGDMGAVPPKETKEIYEAING